jgi:hypothetical protein
VTDVSQHLGKGWRSAPRSTQPDRLADALGFGLLSPEGFESGAKYLLKRGYR